MDGSFCGPSAGDDKDRRLHALDADTGKPLSPTNTSAACMSGTPKDQLEIAGLDGILQAIHSHQHCAR